MESKSDSTSLVGRLFVTLTGKTKSRSEIVRANEHKIEHSRFRRLWLVQTISSTIRNIGQQFQSSFLSHNNFYRHGRKTIVEKLDGLSQTFKQCLSLYLCECPYFRMTRTKECTYRLDNRGNRYIYISERERERERGIDGSTDRQCRNK